jgi:hypothetical protein
MRKDSQMMKIWDRYNEDPMFSRIVDIMVGILMDGQFTPTEMREAAMLAQIKHEDMRPRTATFSKDDVLRGRV